MGTAIDAKEVVKSYSLGAGRVVAVDRLSLEVQEGDFVAVSGRSGSGKTTLLNMLAGLDRPTSGRVRAGGADLGSLSESGLAAWRVRNVGHVFQLCTLLRSRTVIDNVLLPMDFVEIVDAHQRHERARQLLDRVGIANLADRLPDTLSGGELRRAVIARALANDPPLILADEPTGDLDCASGDEVLNLLTDLNYEGRTVVLVSHERDLRAVVKREVTLAEGRIVSDERVASIAL
ncbi:ABC transporter ATP-binding protein [Nocardia barduliensis]|uniref:ABC transporter ATP-binding protein n=1 Tax=Nocardia barduliensis TaxID=2736643 RepID=UPI001574D680|nr:ABC transporter ATP-binding protein [Nocardia barduliensis]